MKLILKLIIAMVVAALLVLGYLGLIPGLSNVIGPQKIADLGIISGEEDFQSAFEKNKILYEELPGGESPAESLKFSGKTNISNAFTSEELSELLRRNAWKYNPIQNGSVRINKDGTAEVAGNLQISRIAGYLEAHGIDYTQVEKYIGPLASLSGSPAFKVKVDASWTDNKLSMNVLDAQLGRLSAPKEYLEMYQSQIENAVESMVLATPNTSIEYLNFKGGTMNTKMTFPSKIEWSTR